MSNDDSSISRMFKWGFPQPWGHPNSWMVYFLKNPNLKWMMTGGTPMTQETIRFLLDYHILSLILLLILYHWWCLMTFDVDAMDVWLVSWGRQPIALPPPSRRSRHPQRGPGIGATWLQPKLEMWPSRPGGNRHLSIRMWTSWWFFTMI